MITEEEIKYALENMDKKEEKSTLSINGKALYTSNGAAREYGRIGCNFYTGCPHGCTYCYLKRGAPSKQLGGTEVRLKKCFRDEFHATDILQQEMDKWVEPCRKYGIFLSFTTDPMLDETRHLTCSAIYGAIQRDIPVWVLTKDATFIYDTAIMAYLENIASDKRTGIHFGFTLTGHDEMEPHASHNQDRIMAMRRMELMGFHTWASIEPVIDWNSAERMIRDSVIWCDHYKIGLHSGVRKGYYKPFDTYEHVKFLVDFIVTLNKTVYLKESVRKLLAPCAYIAPEQYELLLDKTVGMDYFATL